MTSQRRKDQTTLKKLKALFAVANLVTKETQADPDGIPMHAKELMNKVHNIKFGDPGLNHLLDSLKKSSLMVGILSAYWVLDYTRGNVDGCHKHAENLENLIEEMKPLAVSMRTTADRALATKEAETAVKH